MKHIRREFNESMPLGQLPLLRVFGTKEFSEETVTAAISVKRGRPLFRSIILLCTAVVGRMSKSNVCTIIRYISFCSNLARQSGIPFLVYTLKAMSIVVMQHQTGMRLPSTNSFKCRFSRTRDGLPKIIPIHHRIALRRGDAAVIRLWLSLFSIYRILKFSGRYSIGTIVATGGPRISQFLRDMRSGDIIRKLLNRAFQAPVVRAYVEGGPDQALSLLKVKPFLIKKSTPTVNSFRRMPGWSFVEDEFNYLSTSFPGIYSACSAIVGSWAEPLIREWSQLTKSNYIVDLLDMFSRPLPETKKLVTFRGEFSSFIGKLAFLEEPAGKVRVIAMLDVISQWLLRPIHNAVYGILRLIPQDGTFDQLRPLKTLLASNEVRSTYSFDLSAATDRLPVSIQEDVLSLVFGEDLARLWRRLLTDRMYRIVHPKVPQQSVTYAVGQPMGAYSSWAMLALTHHLIVQVAAHRAGVVNESQWFKLYAVLGDDIVIGDSQVAREYLLLMDELDVKVNPSKSLISKRGKIVEFAKRFFMDQKDLTPFTLSEYSTIGLSSGACELSKKYNLSLTMYLKLLGYKHVSLSKCNGSLIHLPKRLRRYILGYLSPSGNGHIGLMAFALAKSNSRLYGSLTINTALSIRVILEMFRNEYFRITNRIDRLEYGIGYFSQVMFKPAEVPSHVTGFEFVPVHKYGLVGPDSRVEVWIHQFLYHCYSPIILDAKQQIIEIKSSFDRLVSEIRSVIPLDRILKGEIPSFGGSDRKKEAFTIVDDRRIQRVLKFNRLIRELLELSSKLDNVPDFTKFNLREPGPLPDRGLSSIKLWEVYGKSARKQARIGTRRLKRSS
jgi:hypothetical protein